MNFRETPGKIGRVGMSASDMAVCIMEKKSPIQLRILNILHCKYNMTFQYINTCV